MDPAYFRIHIVRLINQFVEFEIHLALLGKSNVFRFKSGSFCHQDAPSPIPWQVHLMKNEQGLRFRNLE